ncbi:MAG TPA: hypothetical protein VHB54_19980, partial [Mucilaginibacter sp.]|nr:hypothetical protein [Mucilaginibacter sp.]
MLLHVAKTTLDRISSLRNLFLQDCNFQVRYNAVHERNWSDSYLILDDGLAIGYGSVKGRDDLSLRDAIFEFYLMPAWRKYASTIFKELLVVSKVNYIECQSNDPLLSGMLYEFGTGIYSDVILFKDGPVTDLHVPGATFRERHDGDTLFEHHGEPEGTHVIEVDDKVIATGGFLLHYNKPFADLYMEVLEAYR